jgi:hypothetical protein
MSKIADWENIVTALEKLEKAFTECEDAFNDVDEGELNDIISDNYPFDMSFDELTLEVVEWGKQCRKDIKNKIIGE